MTVLVAVYLSLVLARVAAFVAMLPLLGGTSLPRTVKAGLTLALTALWGLSHWEQMPSCAWLAGEGVVPWLGFGLAVGREVLLGAIVGYAFSLFLLPARVAGNYLAQEMGLSFGNMVNATGDGSSTPVTVIFEMLAAALFLGLDGHHVFFGVMHGLFQAYPVGGPLPAVPVGSLLSGTVVVEEWGLMLAAPAALCLFLTTVALLVMARAASQLNLYTVGFPLRLGVGLAACLILMPQIIAGLVSVFANWSDLAVRIVN